MDGRFLQTTFTATRMIDDPAPDVDCGGAGGLSALRTPNGGAVPVAFCDGHVQNIPADFDLKKWKALATWNGGEAVDLP